MQKNRGLWLRTGILATRRAASARCRRPRRPLGAERLEGRAMLAIITAPSTPDLEAGTDTGLNNDDWTNNPSPTFTGTAEPNAHVEIYDGSTLLGLPVQATSSGAWTFDMATAGLTLTGDGDHFIKARASFDKVSWSGDSNALKVTLDTVPPPAPQTPVLDPTVQGNDTGTPGDGKTSNTKPTLSVEAPQDAARVTIVFTKDGSPASLQATRVSGTNTWRATPSNVLAFGVWTVTATATDIADNASSSSPPLTLTILTPPVAPGMVDLAAADDSGVSSSDDVTNVTKPTFKVTAPVGATKVELFRGTTTIGLATPAPDGVTWSLTLTEPLAHGVHQITAQVTDAGGETSPKSSPLTLTIDTVKPMLQSLGQVTPSPRSTAVSSITSTFSEMVFLVAPTAFQLRYNPGTNDRSLNLNTATTTPVSPLNVPGATVPGASLWTLGNLDSLTGASGAYTLRLDQTGSTVIADQAGNRIAYSATPSRQWTTDVTAPRVASIVLSPAAQEPRSTAVTSATITFSESVAGVDPADFELVRNGTGLSTAGVALSGSGSTYTLSGLDGLTALSGAYTLRVRAAGSGIKDTLGNDFALAGGVTWQMDAQAPNGTFDAVPTPLGAALQSIGLAFSEAVLGVEQSDLSLTRDGAPVSLANATLTPSAGASATYALTGLGSLTATDGAYVLTLSRNAGSPIRDAAGNALAADISRSWTVDTAIPTATIAILPAAGAARSAAVTSATITFSLPVSGVTLGDFQLTRNGSVIPLPPNASVTTGDGGMTWTLGNLQSATAADGDYRLALVAAGSGIVRSGAPANPLAKDAATQWTMDAAKPAATLTVVSKATVGGNVTFTVQALFQEPVTGFALPGGVAVGSGGTASNLRPVSPAAGYTRQYLFDVVVSAPRDPVTVAVNAGAASDAAGNTSVGSQTLSLITDFKAPAVVLSGPALTNASPFVVRVAFSEPVGGFDASDVTVSNGTVSAVNGVVGSPGLYDVSVTPFADGPVAIGIGPSAAADASGNVNGPSNVLFVVVDRGRPSVALTSLSGTLSRESLLRFDATFSEPVVGVAAGDLVVTNGSVSEVQGSGRSYVFVVAPTADGDVTAALAANVAADGAGNKSTAAPSSALVRSDRTAPTATVARLSATTAAIVFSEPILGFDTADLRLTRNGAVLRLPAAPASADRTHWEIDLGPTVAAEGRYLLELLAGQAGITDDAGNALQASADVSWSVDTTSPLAAIGSIPAISRAAIDGGTISFSEPVIGLDVGDFELRRNGAVVPLPQSFTVTPAAGLAAVYRVFGLSNVTAAEGTYSLRLRALDSGIADSSDNALLVDATAAWTVDKTAPTGVVSPVIPVIRSTAVTTIPVTFSEAVTGLDVGDFTLRRNGVVVRLAGAAVTKTGTSGKDYVLKGLATLTSPAGNYELELRALNTGIADLAGNALPSAAFAAWANGKPSNPAAVSAAFAPISPAPRTTAVASATIAFSSPVSGVDNGDFTLTRKVNGSPTGLTGFFVSGSGSQRTIGGLGALTGTPGDYELRLRATGSGIATAGGTPLTADAVVRWTTLPNTAVPPVATITTDQPPSPGTAIDSLTIQFTAPVSGLPLASLRLTRNGVPVSLADTVLSGSGRSYRLRGLAPISASAGAYLLTFVAANSGVADGSGSAPTADAAAAWTVTDTTNRAAFLAVGDQRTSPVAGVALRFSARVKGVDVRDFELLVDGQAVALRGVTVTGSGASWAIGNLSALQAQRGTYTLRLTRANGDILDGSGRVLAADAEVSWTIV